MSRKIKIIVATHKPFKFPADDMYVPVITGVNKNECKKYYGKNSFCDDEGINISKKNKYYSELTALFWGINNLSADYIGLVHYRRHFAGSGEFNTLTFEEACCLLDKTSVILPKKRNYYFDTVYSHHKDTMGESQIIAARHAVLKHFPEYIKSFDNHMKSHKTHICNMFIMKQELLKKYSYWLFTILEEIENNLDLECKSDFEKRSLGRISEWLLDIWINHNKIKYVEIKTKNLQPINYIKKIWCYLLAKIFKKKYNKSF